LTRSGVVSSVHAFAESDFAKIFLVFIALAAGVSAALVVHRLPALKSENELDSMVSRESAFLFNNLLFVIACFAVLWGTMWPVLSEAIQGEKVAVREPWFNTVNVPIGLGLLALTGIGPLLAWRKSSLDSLRRNFTWPFLFGVATGVVLMALGVRHLSALICFTLSAFVIGTIVQEFHKGAKARRVHRGGGYAGALLDLTLVNTRRYGGYVVHFGIVLIFIGFAGSAFDTEKKADLTEGQSIDIRGYEVKFLGLEEGRTANYDWLAAKLEVKKNGKLIGTFAPEKHLYLASQQPTSEVRRHATFREDLYMVFAGVTDSDKTTVQVFVKPLVRWVWIGSFVVFLGTVVTLVPAKRELKLARKVEAVKENLLEESKKKYEVA
jgi:cytochrome c-type biogenesis protein CcmF